MKLTIAIATLLANEASIATGSIFAKATSESLPFSEENKLTTDASISRRKALIQGQEDETIKTLKNYLENGFKSIRGESQKKKSDCAEKIIPAHMTVLKNGNNEGTSIPASFASIPQLEMTSKRGSTLAISEQPKSSGTAHGVSTSDAVSPDIGMLFNSKNTAGITTTPNDQDNYPRVLQDNDDEHDDILHRVLDEGVVIDRGLYAFGTEICEMMMNYTYGIDNNPFCSTCQISNVKLDTKTDRVIEYGFEMDCKNVPLEFVNYTLGIFWYAGYYCSVYNLCTTCEFDIDNTAMVLDDCSYENFDDFDNFQENNPFKSRWDTFCRSYINFNSQFYHGVDNPCDTCKFVEDYDIDGRAILSFEMDCNN